MGREGKQVVGSSLPVKRKYAASSSRAPEEANPPKKQSRSRIRPLRLIDDIADVAEDDEEEDEEEEEEEEEEEMDTDEGEEDEEEEDNDFKAASQDKYKKSCSSLPFFMKEEQLSDEELERLVKERYVRGSEHVVYAEDTKEFDNEKPSVAGEIAPVIWRVKCMVGRERLVAGCLIQKFLDLKSLGTPLKLKSAFALDHVKGFIYIEADKQCDVAEACIGLSYVYPSKMQLVPQNEIPYLLSVQRSMAEVSKDMWVRVKSGQYKSDLALVVEVDRSRRRATVKLVPRIDLQALAKKLEGNGTVKKAVRPAPCLIGAQQLEKFRTHITLRRDRQTGEIFEILDGLMLKDGFLYKRVSVDSLSSWNVQPSDDELQKFRYSQKDADMDSVWLSVLYGRQKRGGTKVVGETSTKRSEDSLKFKKEDSSKFKKEDSLKFKKEDSLKFKKDSLKIKKKNFKVHDLVSIEEEGIGVIIGGEGDCFQVLKGNAEQAETKTVEPQDLQLKLCYMNIPVHDHHQNAVSIKDTVRLLEGPFEGKQGVVKHLYGGTVFVYDENQIENGGYICAKPESCERILHADAKENDGGFVPPGFEEFMSTPTMPESPRKESPERPYQQTRSFRDFGQRGGNGETNFCVGQTLRIRLGPYKGYLCHVVDIYRSDVTVKLNSPMKIMTVSCNYLSEANRKGLGTATSVWGLPQNGDMNPLDKGNSLGGSAWDSMVQNSTRSSWDDAAPSTGFSWDAPAGITTESEDKADNPWNRAIMSNGDKTDPWSKSSDGWGEAKASDADNNNAWKKPSGSWDGQKTTNAENDNAWKKPSESSVEAQLEGNKADSAWNKAIASTGDKTDPWSKSSDGWGGPKTTNADHSNSWKPSGSWGGPKATNAEKDTAWNKQSESSVDAQLTDDVPGSWKKASDSWSNPQVTAGNTRGWNEANVSSAKRGKGPCEDDTSGRSEGGWCNQAELLEKENIGGWGKSSGWGKETESSEKENIGGWGNSSSRGKQAESSDRENIGGWGNSHGPCKQLESSNKENIVGSGDNSGWGKQAESSEKENIGGWGQASSWNEASGSRGKAKVGDEDKRDGWNGSGGGWGKTDSWANENQSDGWNSGGGWGKTEFGSNENQRDGWNNSYQDAQAQPWGKSQGWSGGEGASEEQGSFGNRRDFGPGGRGGRGERGRGRGRWNGGRFNGDDSSEGILGRGPNSFKNDNMGGGDEGEIWKRDDGDGGGRGGRGRGRGRFNGGRFNGEGGDRGGLGGRGRGYHDNDSSRGDDNERGNWKRNDSSWKREDGEGGAPRGGGYRGRGRGRGGRWNSSDDTREGNYWSNTSGDQGGSWGQGRDQGEGGNSGWGGWNKQSKGENQGDWNKGTKDQGCSWGKDGDQGGDKDGDEGVGGNSGWGGANKQSKGENQGGWNKGTEDQGCSWGQDGDQGDGGNSGWGGANTPLKGDSQASSWNKPLKGDSQASSWNKPLKGDSQASSWNKPLIGDSQASSWNKPLKGDSQASSWNKPKDSSGDDRGYRGGNDSEISKGGWGDRSNQWNKAGSNEWGKPKGQNGGWSKEDGANGEGEASQWNKPKETIEARGDWNKLKGISGDQDGHWNKEAEDQKEGGGWNRPPKPPKRNEEDSWNKVTNDWNKPKDASGGWSKEQGASEGGQLGSWGQPPAHVNTGSASNAGGWGNSEVDHKADAGGGSTSDWGTAKNSWEKGGGGSTGKEG